MSSDKKGSNTAGVNRRHILAAATVGTALAGRSALGSSARTVSAGTKKSIENTPVILECAINGGTTKAKNPLAPGTLQEHPAELEQMVGAYERAKAEILDPNGGKAVLRNQELSQPINDQINKAVEQLASEGGFDLIIDVATVNVVFMVEGLDLTEEVLASLATSKE